MSANAPSFTPSSMSNPVQMGFIPQQMMPQELSPDTDWSVYGRYREEDPYFTTYQIPTRGPMYPVPFVPGPQPMMQPPVFPPVRLVSQNPQFGYPPTQTVMYPQPGTSPQGTPQQQLQQPGVNATGPPPPKRFSPGPNQPKLPATTQQGATGPYPNPAFMYPGRGAVVYPPAYFPGRGMMVPQQMFFDEPRNQAYNETQKDPNAEKLS